jgi:ATP-binding cassette subfamily A (ABC1) protein 3
MILYCFFMSFFFRKAKISTVIAVIVWILTYVPYNVFFIKSDLLEDASTFPHFLVSLLPNSGMGFGFSTIIALEQKDVGLQWSNLFTRNDRTKISVGDVLLSFLMSSLMFVLLIIHFEETDVEISKPKKWGYPFNILFDRLFGNFYENLNDVPQVIVDDGNFEKEVTDTSFALSVKQLTKVYRKSKRVDSVSFNTQWKQTQVLLGLNHSGKSTIISLLATLIKPTSGSILVEGKDVDLDLEEYRKSLGVCFQESIVIDNLSVKENIEFFSYLRGVQEVKNEVDKYVELLDLKLSVNIRAGKLKREEKRKLAIAIAFCGNPKVVLLDDPTIGLEVDDKRRVLDLIRSEKMEKTIVISTHLADEAEYLGDRIAVLDKGCIVSAGTVSFLKKHFGVGYRLVCQKLEDLDSENVTDLLRNWIPDVTVQSDIGNEITYILEENKRSIFYEMFRTLETESEKLGITGFDVVHTNLEDVILKISTDPKIPTEEAPMREDQVNSPEDQPIFNSFDSELIWRHEGFILTLLQILAIIKKKFYYIRHNWKFLFINLMITIIYVLFITVLPESEITEYPSLKISLANYSKTNVYLQSDNSTAANIYQKLVSGSQTIVQVPMASDMNDYILKNASNYVIGATFNGSSITGWFNNEYYHSQPLSLNLINQALLKNTMGEDYGLTVINKPFHFSRVEWFEHQFRNLNSTRIIITLLLVYTFWITIFITSHIKEKTSGAKLLQYLSGVSRCLFWTATLLLDLVIFVVIAFLVIMTIGIITYTEHFTVRIGHMLIVSMFFGYSALSWMYLTTLFSKEAFDAKINSLLFASTSGLLLIINSLIDDLNEPISWIQYLLRLSPYYELGDILHRSSFYSYDEIVRHQCRGICTIQDLCQRIPFFCSEYFLVVPVSINRDDLLVLIPRIW